jgi:2,3-bisphosphoglycerate-independent phosphoglycerate mutase
MNKKSPIANPKSQIPKRPLALIIVDGWGFSPRREGNAIALAHTPYYDEISKKYPKTLLEAAGTRVGLKEGAAGNSEVGHMNIGAGRIIHTEVARIDRAIRDESFFTNEVLLGAMRKAKENDSALHLIGLLSDGGVHSSPEHLFALLRMAKKIGLEKVFIHAILDGRDVPPRTADIYTEALEIKMADIGVGRLASLCGRYYAMDKDQYWERTARAYTMLVHAEGEHALDAITAIRHSFLRGVSDEFIQPIILEESIGTPVATVKNGDAVIFFNHRGDRIRQLVKALSVNETDAPSGVIKPQTETVCLTEYDRSFALPAAFPPDEETNVLAQIFARQGILNCRLTETEKYAHVTYFFNGGVEVEHPCEQRILISPGKNNSNEVQPEMGSFKVTDKLLRGLEAGENDVFIVNLAAPDVIAHTGDLNKTIDAVQFVDTCLGGIVQKIRDVNGVAIITSDHGNCEEMIDPESGEQNNSHTKNPVPFHLIDEHANGLRLLTDGALEDIAPTILGILGIEKPVEMTGRDLRIDAK